MAPYLPVLLVSVSAAAVPDDSALEPLPRGQVDYLSHDWEEEDVWRSWRSMTRQKNEIANGMRLENASWRTWWKQRNKLKTISPETLNWLKDSDVTWLYGPLHTALDWSPPPKPKPDPTEVGKESSTEDKLDLAQVKQKSILKHRSISELLQSDLMTSPLFSPTGSDEEDGPDDTAARPVRPLLVQTKSAPHIHPPTHPSLRKPSPPRVLPPSMAADAPPSAPARRHITFNTFVEQCIAIDSPRRYPLSQPSFSSPTSFSAEDATVRLNGSRSWNGRTSGRRWANPDDDDDSDDDGLVTRNWATSESALSSDSDEALEICLPRSRSGSRSSSSTSKSALGLSVGKTQSKTIAPIPPTRLKTKGVGNSWAGGEWVGMRDENGHLAELEDDNDTQPLHRTGASGNLQASAAANSLVSAFDDDEDEEDEVFTHQSSYFSTAADAYAYDYFAGPDIGVEFAEGPAAGAREPRLVAVKGTPTVQVALKVEIPLTVKVPDSVARDIIAARYVVAAQWNKSDDTIRTFVAAAGTGDVSRPGHLRIAVRLGIGVNVFFGVVVHGEGPERDEDGVQRQRKQRPLSPEYTGVRVSGGGDVAFASSYGGGVAGARKKVGGSPDKAAARSLATTSPSTSSSPSIEDDNSSSGATAKVDAPPSEERPSVTPANSPVVNMRVPSYIRTASIASSSSSSSTLSSSPSLKSAPPNKSDPTFATTAASPGKGKSIPKPNGLLIDGPSFADEEDGYVEDAEEDYDDATPRRGIPTPANSPVARIRQPARTNGWKAPSASQPQTPTPTPTPTTAKSISPPKTRTKPPNTGTGPTSPARATFQNGTGVFGGHGSAAGGGAGSPSEYALQRTLEASPPPLSLPLAPQLSGSISPPERDEGTIVGKAVGMVTSAGAYFGLWGAGTQMTA
ncbi:DUF1752 domain-containing protein [Mycena kentingensis (nom. inval.)]|nr:DUF1752 domain-containing protein [Mycena kentingensis (nom. inval.)]